jgi:hypothetical protein
LRGDDPRLRAELEALLRAHEHAGDFLEHPSELVEAAARAMDVDDEFAPGDRVDRYELVEPLGRGGAGSVWRARQQTPVVRDVALKLLRRGHDGERATARFLAERQLLARMEHPGVAKVFDAGAMPDGRPWLAMELVDGEPITRHCASAGTPLRARLELFVAVAAAVQHAHGKGVVHRDLKPSNVLVTRRDGVVRPVVIDFGVAAARDEQQPTASAAEELLGTPDYMSPEQAAGDVAAIDVRTDVYALGVLLYELVCGERPHRREPGLEGIRRLLAAIPHEVPPPPSQRTRHRLPRELDWITAKALQKDPARRYSSAAELAADVQRLLDDQPVEAGPDRAWYRLRKFATRHRLAAAAAAAILLTTGGGLLIASLGWRHTALAEQQARLERDRAETSAALARTERDRAEVAAATARTERDRAARAAAEAKDERDRAERESRKANRAIDLLDELWGDVDRSRLARSDYTVQDLLMGFERALPARTAGEPEVELRLRCSLASLQSFAGRADRAELHATRAVALAGELGRDAEQARALLLRARARFDRGDLVGADEDALAALAVASALPEAGELAQASGLELHADCLLRSGRHAEAVSPAERSLQLREANGAPDLVARSLMLLARVHGSIGRVDLATDAVQRTLELLAPLGELHPDLLSALQHLAFLQMRRGDRAAAEVTLRDLLRRRIEVFGEDHPMVGWVQSDLGWLLHEQGRDADGEPFLRAALPVLRARLGEEHLYVTETMQRLGAVCTGLGRHDEARELLSAALARYGSLPGHPVEGWLACSGNLASLRWQLGEREQALADQRVGMARARSSLPADHYLVSIGLTNLARMESELGHLEVAVELLREALARSLANDRRADAELQRQRLRELLTRLGRTVEAEALAPSAR